MKKTSLLNIFLLFTIAASSQSYIGLLTDNYSGVHGVISNPANVVDSRFRTDINLVGISSLFGNDFYSVGLSDLDTDTDFADDSFLDPSDSNNLFGNADILGPSFMFNINAKNSIALTTRGRVLYNVNDISGQTYESLIEDFDDQDDFMVNEGDFFVTGTAWAEIGLTYGRVLMDKQTHFLKGGLTLKYIQGIANFYTLGENVTLDYDADGTALPGGQTSGTIETTGTVTYGSNSDDEFDDFEVAESATGFGADLGLVYEWRPDYKEYQIKNKEGETVWDRNVNKYKLKFGMSLTDLGSINFDGGTQTTYNINGSITEEEYDNAENIEEALNDFYTVIDDGASENSVLPTALHVNGDWNINHKFYVNLNADLSLTSKSKLNANRITNIVTLTPRFERKWFTFQVPLSVLQYSGFQAGTGFRAGPLYLGSGSIISSLISDNVNAIDFYFGLKVPIYHRKVKDQDGDGIKDKVDECPLQPGPAANFGCPWPDNDNDGLLDKDDTCPEVPGPEENKGCPWPDTDEDGLLDKDDACPEVAGPQENNGCPWSDTDNDGVADKDDQCPDVVGTVVNNGCPEVTEEIQNTLNEYAKTILFNLGKSSIKEESDAVLQDIVAILNEYPTAKFSIEGHTDSSGSNITNQKLSDARANAVKTYLIDKGIDQFRLSAIGFGEDRPIASNKTKVGRAQNRRVEINLVKE
ncbi:DUF5723 family protein [Aquimarina sp. ERC-38]|uniref:DUF5723 family protein n=1 Tax=Aquimarina sp. ERC-38 TaxID=2949996 RepID=UPI00224675C4|nr:DUF5723 family protein [Aquimarina sp. ERC-38]UZO80215.1 DUF5723 family protein [Aquimarina sp. ERC-38]